MRVFERDEIIVLDNGCRINASHYGRVLSEKAKSEIYVKSFNSGEYQKFLDSQTVSFIKQKEQKKMNSIKLKNKRIKH